MLQVVDTKFQMNTHPNGNSAGSGDMPGQETRCEVGHARDLLAILQFRGVGVAAVRKAAAILSRKSELSAVEAVEDVTKGSFSKTEVEQAYAKCDQILERCADISVRAISMLDVEYPRRLKWIKDAPPIIYVKGSIDALSLDGCAVVGTRKSSSLGEKIAGRVVRVLTARNFSTVSGLALGIDASAHRAALQAGGVTIAIMAHGLDSIAPSSHKALADQILSAGGALISEHEPGVPARPAEFVRRNRIQSGMSICSIIVESGAVGGAIHQARFTREQGRPVVVALPDLKERPDLHFNAEGGELLASTTGAIPLQKAEDLDVLLDGFLKTESSKNF